MNKTFKYIVLLALACFVGKANAQELKTEVFSLLNLDYPGLEKVKTLHQEGKDADAAKALLDYYRARTNVKTPDINLKKVTISKDDQKRRTMLCSIHSLLTKVINRHSITVKTSTGDTGR